MEMVLDNGVVFAGGDDAPLLIVGAAYACRTCGVTGSASGENTWIHPIPPRTCPNEGIHLGRGFVRPVDEPAQSALAVTRALTPEQREALVAIGEDAADLLNAARETVKGGSWTGFTTAIGKLAAVLSRIDARVKTGSNT